MTADKASPPSAAADDGYDALAADGTPVHLRRLRPDDREELRGLVSRLSARSTYQRFFAVSPNAALDHLAKLLDPSSTAEAVVVIRHGHIVALSSLHPVGDGTAEFALLVDDAEQGQGIGTLLTEDFAARAGSMGLRELVGSVLAGNAQMVEVLRNCGFEVSQSLHGGVIDVSLSLARSAAAEEAIDRREARAEIASVDHLLRPASVAVVGAGRHRHGTGRQVLEHLRQAGYTGRLYVVNRQGHPVDDTFGAISVELLPEPVDLAVIAVPAASVLAVARDCAAVGVHALVVLSAGFGETGDRGRADEDELRRICRAAGMRLLGPNCIGVANTDPDVRLDATFLPIRPGAGHVALIAQSGAVAAAMLTGLRHRGSGVSGMVSVGNKADVSVNDLLPWCETDPRTRVVALYLESIGDARGLAGLATRISRTTPIVLVKSGRTPAAAAAASSHTAAAADDDAAVEALCRSTGMLRVPSIRELADVSALLGSQPVPRGRRVAIVGNSGGPGIMAVDACAGRGMSSVRLSAGSRRRLQGHLPGAASIAGPVDVTAAADVGQLRLALNVTAADPGVDAVLALVTPLHHLPQAVINELLDEASAAHPTTTFLTCVFGDGDWAGRVPRLEDSDAAAAALSRAAEYGETRGAPEAHAAERLQPVTAARAAAVIQPALTAAPGGRWLTAAECAALMRVCDVPVVPTMDATDAEGAVDAAAVLRYPLVVKARGSGLLHKFDVGGVITGVHDPVELREAVTRLHRSLGHRLDGVLLQPQVQGVAELIVGGITDSRFGALVMVGRGGVTSDVDPDRVWAMAPISPRQARHMIASLRMVPVLRGHRGRPAADLDRLSHVVVNVSQLMSEIPQIAELDLNPVIVTATGPLVVDVRVRVSPQPARGHEGRVRRLGGNELTA